MFVNCLLLLGFIGFCIWKSILRPQHFPPGPAWMPIVGNLCLVAQISQKFKFYHLMWAYFSKCYGTIVGFKFGSQKVIIVSGRKAIKELYSNEAFDGRPDGFFFRIRTFEKKLGVVFVDDLSQRHFLLKHMRQRKQDMAQQIQHEAGEMVKFFQKKVKEQPDGIEMQNAFDVSVLNVMWTILAGERFELDEPRLLYLLKMIHENFRIIDMSGGILNYFPSLRYIIPEASGYRSLLRTLQPLWKFLEETIKEIRERDNRLESSSLIEDMLFEMRRQSNPADCNQDEQLLSVCLDFFQAGSETTSNTISFGICHLINNQRVLLKMQTELDAVIGSNRLPTLSDRDNLPYTNAVISEIQRFSNVAPLAIAKKTLSTASLGQFKIPKDTIAIVSLYSLHMEQEAWGDPFVFRPERFLDVNDRAIKFDNFFPFGSGKRRCMGENIAKYSLFLLFASFIHSFEIRTPEGCSMPDTEGIDGITLSPKPFKVILTPRNQLN